MTTADIPSDLIELRREFLAAQEVHSATLAEWPSATDIIGGAEVPDELRARMDAAYFRMLELVVAMQRSRTAAASVGQ